ncbi:alpha/beta-hydrolase [Aureobasidium pullulans]|uniref:Alpha/beta-hydrolase n=1 Tax=Aureobasidium pullulans TaxID=5580 RepID=A0A4V4IMQ2_AURPU|nr:alpha/beta-hydrolase [Aureobasidium pullulans]THZ91663.1 alpha/beta-hydrolase [Aureobasidium pullulans]
MHLYSAFAIIFLAVQSSSAAVNESRVSNLQLEPEQARIYGCRSHCQSLLSEADPVDRDNVGAYYDAKFYATSPDFASSTPGDVLKKELVHPGFGRLHSISRSVWRFQYTSLDANDSLVPSSGIIMFPRTSMPDIPLGDQRNVLPLVAYAHGTIGQHYGCAPSSGMHFFEQENLEPLLAEGYTVVATDYAGLGNNYTSHKYLSFAAHANDIYYSVVAARKMFPIVFNDKWMSIGHSQGGGAVWKLAEHPLVQDPRSGYVGTVSIAPAVNMSDLATTTYEKILPLPNYQDYSVTGLSALLLTGIKAAYPEYQMPWAADALQNMLHFTNITQSCAVAITTLATNLRIEQIMAPGAATPMNDDILKQWTQQHAAAQGDPASMPMLLIQGLEDTAVLPECTIRAYESATRLNTIGLLEYSGLNHTAVIAASVPRWLQFMKDRFSDHPTDFETSRVTFDANSTIAR